MELLSSSQTSYPGQKALQPMNWSASLLHFGIPALGFVLGFYGLMPFCIARGMPFFYAYCLALAIPLIGLIVAALVATRAEGIPLQWSALTARWRIRGMSWRAWTLTLLTFAVAVAAYGAVAILRNALLARGIIPIPDGLPAFLDPRQEVGAQNITQLFGDIRGNWWALVAFIALLFLNITGEELWWRGYVLPRQELFFGHWTWLVHGLLWNVFHIFKWWDLLPLLPVTLLIAFLAYRQRSTMPAIVVHTLFNAMGILPLVLGIMS